MIIVDTSGLLAAIDAAQPHHESARAVVEADSGPFFLSPFVLAEIDYLLCKRCGVKQELAFLAEVVAGAWTLADFSTSDVRLAREVVAKYEELGVGLADASVVVLAARHGTKRILTLDERHFRVLRSLDGGSFELLPADR